MFSRSAARSFALVLAALFAVTAGAFLTPIGPAIAKEAQAVFVINTAAEPVPASIVGTASVSVANTPTVNVAKTREPVQGSRIIATGGTFVCDTIYTVPAGKRLTIEYVNALAFGLIQGNFAGVRLGGTQTFANVTIPMQPVVGGEYAGSEMIQFFSTTNVTACATFAQAQGAFAASLEVSWSGHLEDLD